MMSNTVHEHKQLAAGQLRCAVITVSDSRTIETDGGGQLVVELLTLAGHQIAGRQIIPDEPLLMQSLVESFLAAGVDAILLTGGTGISRRDQTFETIREMIEKPLPGYGELFRMLSFQQIGSAAMLSRAIAGICRESVIFTMPGSPAAVRLAMQELIIPELPHVVSQARR